MQGKRDTMGGGGWGCKQMSWLSLKTTKETLWNTLEEASKGGKLVHRGGGGAAVLGRE